MTLILLNRRQRELFRATATDAAGAWFTYYVEAGGGYVSRDDMYRAAAVVMLDRPSAQPAGPLAGLFRQHCQTHRASWPYSHLKHGGQPR